MCIDQLFIRENKPKLNLSNESDCVSSGDLSHLIHMDNIYNVFMNFLKILDLQFVFWIRMKVLLVWNDLRGDIYNRILSKLAL